MKARHIRKIRLKLKNEKFLTDNLKKWAQEEKALDHFYRFKCSEFFEGKTGAELNKKEYYNRMDICSHKIEQLKRLLNNI